MRIAVVVPTHDMMPALFGYDLAQLCAFTVATMPEDVQFGLHMVTGTYIHAARQDLADAVVAQGCDYVLWLDSDMRFPRDALVRLIQHKVPVAGINYSKRRLGGGFVAIDLPDKPLATNEDSTGLEEVFAVGFGCVLMRASVFQGLPDPKETPWFQHKHLGKGQWMGEDVHFCQLVREAGGRIYVDHDLSRECAHIGQFEFQPVHATMGAEPLILNAA